MQNKLAYLFISLLFIWVSACRVDPNVKVKADLPVNDIRFVVPSGFPPPVYNFSGNPLTTDGFILGRALFYETKLSKDNTISCGSCHQQFAAFSHLDHPLSHGIYGLFGTRNSPALFNLAWKNDFMWDGGINNLEVQALAPITNPVEMDEDLNNVIIKLQNDPDYPTLFKKAFGSETINSQRLFWAFAQFMGMLNSYNSKYDKYTRGESGGNMSISELNGLSLVRQKCTPCHQEPLFTDMSFRNNGLSINPNLLDTGRMHITGLKSDSMKFKVPSLRNVALSQPYMHDGRYLTLMDVLNHYTSGIHNYTTLDPLLTNGIILSNQEKQDIISFLQTLSDYTFINDARFKDPN